MNVRLTVRPIAVLLAGAVVAVGAFSTSASGAGGPAISTPPTVAGSGQVGRDADSHPRNVGECAHLGRLRLAALQRHRQLVRGHRRRSGRHGHHLRADLRRRRADGARRLYRHRRRRDDGLALGGHGGGRFRREPQNSLPPTISGTTTEGQTLVGTDGTWAGAAPITFTYAWSRCDATGAACTPITGATSKTYVLVAADNGKTLRLSVTAKNTPGSDTQTSAPTAVVVALNPPSVVTLPSGGKSIDAVDVHAPAAQLIIDRVSFTPNPLRSRAAFTARIHISDSRGYSVRNALVFVEGLPFGRSSTPAEVKTGSDGTATLTLIPTTKLPLQKGATLVMFVRARVAGDRLIAGASARRLVNLRVVPS